MDPEPDTDRLPEPEERQTAALSHLGAEGLSRLRARYAEVLARITDRPLEETTREELEARAERLNPDAWVTEEEVRRVLSNTRPFSKAFESVVGTPPATSTSRITYRLPARSPDECTTCTQDSGGPWC